MKKKKVRQFFFSFSVAHHVSSSIEAPPDSFGFESGKRQEKNNIFLHFSH